MQNLVTKLHPQFLWARVLVGALLVLAFLALLAPLAALAQGAVTIDPDNWGWLATLVLDAIRGGNWQVAVLGVLVVLVGLVRRLGPKIPALGTFLGTDPGGVILTLATVLPIGLLTAKLGSLPVTWTLAWGIVASSVGAFVILKKLVRPLVALIPKVGPYLVALIDLVTGPSAPAKAPPRPATVVSLTPSA